MMHATVLLFLDRTYLGGHHILLVLFEGSLTKVANKMILAVCQIVSRDHNDHGTKYFGQTTSRR
jgi:hypothetical protein